MWIYGPEDGRTVADVDHTTPTEVSELTLIEQLLGNFGQFNPSGDSNAGY